MNILFLSHTHMGSTFVVGSHHLAREMAKMGHDVLHVSTPITLLHSAKLSDPEVARRTRTFARGGIERDRVFDYVPMGALPWKAHARARLPLAWFGKVVPSIARALARRNMSSVDLALVDDARMFGALDEIGPKRVVYRATDLYAKMLNDPAIVEAEREVLRRADRAVGTSAPVVDHLRALAPSLDVDLIENGVDVAMFSETRECPRDLSAISGPRAVYVGAFDERFDFECVEALARRDPRLQVVLIGPKPARSARSVPANLHWLGPRSYQDIPAYLQNCEVGLLPLSAQASNQGRSPMKIYEYGLSGLPVVASKTDELARRALPFVRLADDPHAFVDATLDLVRSSARGELAEAGRRVSRGFGWSAAAQRLVAM